MRAQNTAFGHTDLFISQYSNLFAMESEEDEISVHVREHYEKRMCTHTACAVSDALILAQSFGNMAEDDRINTIRCMMLAFTSPTGMKNAISYFQTMHVLLVF